MTCPKCGHKIEITKQVIGEEINKLRWRGVSKKKRTELARNAARARWDKEQIV
jgi:hypothetical protein